MLQSLSLWRTRKPQPTATMTIPSLLRCPHPLPTALLLRMPDGQGPGHRRSTKITKIPTSSSSYLPISRSYCYSLLLGPIALLRCSTARDMRVTASGARSGSLYSHSAPSTTCQHRSQGHGEKDIRRQQWWDDRQSEAES